MAEPDLLMCCQIVYYVGVTRDTGREKWCHAIAILLHGSSKLE